MAIEHMSKTKPAVEAGEARSLEIGCGRGYHFRFADSRTHIGLDVRFELLQHAKRDHSTHPLIRADAYQLPFTDDSFDRVVSVYTFEHLRCLPDSLVEIRRVLVRGGELLVGLPAEGGLAYEWGRKLTSKRYFERRYAVDYLRLVRSEHCNLCLEVLEELEQHFVVEIVKYLPFRVPSIHLNAVVVARCVNSWPQQGE